MCETLLNKRQSLQNEIREIDQEIEKFRELVELTLNSEGIHVFTNERFRGLGLTTLIVDFALIHELPLVVMGNTQREMICRNLNIPHSQVITVSEIRPDFYDCRGRIPKAVVVDYIDMFDPALERLDNLGIKYFGFLRKYN